MPNRPTSSKRQPPRSAAFRAWRDVAAFERSKIMRKAAALLRSCADVIARMLTQEEG